MNVNTPLTELLHIDPSTCSAFRSVHEKNSKAATAVVLHRRSYNKARAVIFMRDQYARLWLFIAVVLLIHHIVPVNNDLQ